MARILQIRRGTTVQNDNFTGLCGELSFDTDTKTLRVHDGEKLGGYELAMARTDGDASMQFDINDVPDDFWAALFARFATASGDTSGGNGTGLTILESYAIPISSAKVFEYVMTTTATAQFVQAVLICNADDAGYSAGDICTAFGIGDHCHALINTFHDERGLHIRMYPGDGEYWVPDNDTAAHNKIDTAKWDIKFRVYC